MSRQPGNLVAAIVIAAISGAIILLVPSTLVVRLVAALPLLFLLPGYAITSALFPKRSLGIPEQLLFSVGISIAVVIVGGFALHWTPWGLQAGSWVALLFSVTLVASLVADTRWQRTAPISGMPLNFALDSRQGLLLGLAALVITAAIVLARTPLPPQAIQGYTQLWILPASDKDPGAVRVGISSMEFTPTEYRLQIMVDDQVLQEWPTLQLGPGEDWETSVLLPKNSSHTRIVKALLYRQDDPSVVYRRVLLRQGN